MAESEGKKVFVRSGPMAISRRLIDDARNNNTILRYESKAFVVYAVLPINYVSVNQRNYDEAGGS